PDRDQRPGALVLLGGGNQGGEKFPGFECGLAVEELGPEVAVLVGDIAHHDGLEWIQGVPSAARVRCDACGAGLARRYSTSAARPRSSALTTAIACSSRSQTSAARPRSFTEASNCSVPASCSAESADRLRSMPRRV